MSFIFMLFPTSPKTVLKSKNQATLGSTKILGKASKLADVSRKQVTDRIKDR